MSTKVERIAAKLIGEFGESTFKECMGSIEHGSKPEPGSKSLECELRLNELLEDHRKKDLAIGKLIEIANS